MFSKGIAVISLTKQGAETAIKISDALSKVNVKNNVFTPEQCARGWATPLEGRLSEFVKEQFGKVDGIVAVMAAGIIIRAVAPCLKSKRSDPAIVCVDVSGRFAISLLSGHFGGANELTRLIAKEIGATPVITTASDVLGKISVDELAKVWHCSVQNPARLVAVNSALVNGGNLVIVLVGDVKVSVNGAYGYEVKAAKNGEQAVEIANGFDGGVVVSRSQITESKFTKPVVVLKPKRIIVGIGARKNVNECQVLAAVDSALTKACLPLERVDGLATVEIKKDSLSITGAAKKLGLPIDFVGLEALRGFKHEDLSPDSKLVKEKIGVGGVCEQAALIVAGKQARLILKKTKMNGVTVAIAEGE